MAEQLSHQGPEQAARSVEHADERQRTEHAPKHHAEAGHDTEAEQRQTAEHALAEAKREAVSGKDVSIEKTSNASNHGTSPLVSRELRKLMFKRTLTSVQKQLSAPSRTMSRVMHNPVVDRVSIAAEKTVARPKGILVGGLLAFLGSVYTLYLAKHYGFSYNLLLFVILFATGYIVTTLIEVVVIVLKRTFRD